MTRGCQSKVKTNCCTDTQIHVKMSVCEQSASCLNGKEDSPIFVSNQKKRSEILSMHASLSHREEEQNDAVFVFASFTSLLLRRERKEKEHALQSYFISFQSVRAVCSPVLHTSLTCIFALEQIMSRQSRKMG